MKFQLWRRRRREEELEEEIQSHLRMAIRDHMERGESVEEAESAARREFGNVGLIKETTRGMWGFGALETIWRDLRYGGRMLLRNPGLTIASALTLALGIGANTVLFSLVNGLLMRPPVATQPEQLMRIDKMEEGVGNHTSFPNYRDLVEGTQSFSALAAFSQAKFNLGEGETMGRVVGEFVTGNFFPTLGTPPALGRTFGIETGGASGAHPVAVISYGFWRRRFGGDARLVGQTIILNKHRFTVIGIMPEGFRGAWPGGIAPEVWIPVTMQPQLLPGKDRFGDRGDHWLQLVGRLKPGVSQGQAQAAVSLVTRRLAESYPRENRELGNAVVFPLGNIPELFIRVIPVIVGVVTVIAGMVLLLVCANIANLLLARAATRRQEMAIRLALGAHPRRLIRQLLTESLLLALAGGAAGCLLAVWLTSIMRSSRLPMTPIELNATLDARALCFTLAISTLSGVLFGLAPAWHASKFDLVPMLKDDQRVGGGRPARFRLRNLLVISQVAVSLVFLICAGLFMRSLRQANSFDPGFETERLLTVPLDLESAGYDEARGRLFYQQILDQFEEAPGAQSAALAEGIPLKDGWGRYTDVAVEGHDAPGGDYPGMRFNTVGPRYFETMGIPVLAGREFNHEDVEGAPFVAVVNETMARRFWPGQSPLGRRLRFIQEKDVLSPYYEVVGMVKDSKYSSLGEEPQPFFFVSAMQNYRQRLALHLRATGEPSLLRGAVRDRILALDKGLLVEVSTMRENLAMAFLPARVAAIVLGLVGLFGLSLAVVGIYGVISYAVSQRTGEIGLRMALGAESRDILRLVIGQGLKLTLIGVVLGTALALAVTRLLSRILIGVSAADPLTFLAVPLLLATVAFFACWIPARRATKVDPMIALRCE